MEDPSASRVIHHVDTSNVLQVHPVSSCDKRQVTINILPDDVLLHIFHCYGVVYVDGPGVVHQMRRLSWWHELVHVCQRWRSVVFASPNFLDLKLVCRPGTRVEFTDIWPPFPIIIRNSISWPMPNDYDFEAATVHHNRICEIDLHITSLQLQRLASAMQKQFPALVHLKLKSHFLGPAPVLPDGFLDGSAPSLQSLELGCIAFPALPKYLLSATDVVCLYLWEIPPSGYFSPEAIVTSLAVLTNLKSLAIGFRSPLTRPDLESRHPPPPSLTVLPALTRLEFRGVTDYLENFVARIDTPLLDTIQITFFPQPVFDIPQLAKFMRRMTRSWALNEAHVIFDYSGVQVGYPLPTRTFDGKSWFRIISTQLDRQLSSLAQVFTLFFPSIYMVEDFFIYGDRFVPIRSQDDVTNMHWLAIFRPLTAGKSLYLSEQFAQCIAPVLQGLVGESVTDVLPALENIFLEKLQRSGPVQEAIGQFVAARQLLGHTVAVSDWDGL